jgi:hypothetical protein
MATNTFQFTITTITITTRIYTMTLKVDVSQMADIAKKNKISGTSEYIKKIEQAAGALAERIAMHFDIQSTGAEHQPVEFSGLLASFGPKHPRQTCPAPISEADPSGDWE